MSDIRTALEEAFSSAETDPVDPAPTEVAEPVVASETTQTTERPRSADGKLAATEAKPEEPIAPAPPPERNAFSSWKPAAQQALQKADRGEPLTADELKLVKAEAERRESDFHKGVSEFKTHSERAKAYDAAVAPYQQHLQRMGVDAPTAISALMRADQTLRTADPQTKVQYFARLAKEYGIDLNQVQNPEPVDPQTQFLMQELNELRQSQQMWQNQVQQQEQARVQTELQAFQTADKPHFDAVRNDMADLLESGKAKSLQDAYEMAVWMRPDVRQSLIDQQLADAQRKALEQAQAQRAKTAAVGVKGSSPIGAGSQPVNGSLRDILAAQFADN